MTHARFVVVAGETRARIYHLTIRWSEGRLRRSLIERAHCERAAEDADDAPFADAIVDTLLRAVRDASAPSVVVSTAPRMQRCLRARMPEVVFAGASVCEIERDLTRLEPVALQDELVRDELL